MKKSFTSWDKLSSGDKKKHLDLYNKFDSSDKSGFEFFYNHLFRMVRNVPYKILKGAPGYHEITNDCFIDTWNKKIKFTTPEKLKNYLMSAARNKSLNYLKSARKPKDISSYDEDQIKHTEDPHRQMEAKDIYRLVHNHLNKLPAHYKEILKAKIDGKKNLEIAQELNLSQQQIASIISKARKWLIRRLPG